MRQNYSKRSPKQSKIKAISENTKAVKVKVVPSNNSTQSYSPSIPPNPYRLQRTT